jgi:hypothetical protein
VLCDDKHTAEAMKAMKKNSGRNRSHYIFEAEGEPQLT